eukprot:scaffold179358_cov31-Tisochrysis_lutea.AAC.1
MANKVQNRVGSRRKSRELKSVSTRRCQARAVKAVTAGWSALGNHQVCTANAEYFASSATPSRAGNFCGLLPKSTWNQTESSVCQ